MYVTTYTDDDAEGVTYHASTTRGESVCGGRVVLVVQRREYAATGAALVVITALNNAHLNGARVCPTCRARLAVEALA